MFRVFIQGYLKSRGVVCYSRFMNTVLRNNWVKAIAVNIVILVVTLICTDLAYETNDDYVMSLRMVDGYPYFTFLNYFFAKAVIGIQSFMPGYNAFVITQMALSFAAFTLLAKLFFDTADRSGANKWVRLAAVFGIAAFAIDQYCAVQFTKTAVLLLVAGSIIITDTLIKKRGAGYLAAGFFLLYAGACLRFTHMLVAVGFTGIFLLAWVVMNRSSLKPCGYFRKGRVAVYIATAVLLLGTLGVNAASSVANNSTEELANYWEYDIYRTYVTDFPVYSSYEENAEEYEKAGISENDLYLMKNWYIDYDGAASTENLKKIYSIYEKTDSAKRSFKSAARTFVRETIGNVKGPNKRGMHIIMLVLLGLAALLAYKPKYAWYVVLVALFTILLYVYLYYIGRPAYRATYAADAGATLWLLYYISGAMADSDVTDKACGIMRKPAFAVVSIILAVVFLAGQLPAYNSYQSLKASNEGGLMSEEMTEFISENPDNLYVYGRGQKGASKYYVTPARVPEDGDQTNAIGFGSWGSDSPYILDKLGRFGVSNVFSDTIDNPSVFVFEGGNKNRLEEYLNKWYAEDGGKIVLEHAGTHAGHDMWQVKRLP